MPKLIPLLCIVYFVQQLKRKLDQLKPMEDICDQSALCFILTGFVFSVFKVLLVEREAGSHVGLEDLCDGVDVGGRPDVETQIHPDKDNDDNYDDDDDEDDLSVCLSQKQQILMMMCSIL